MEPNNGVKPEEKISPAGQEQKTTPVVPEPKPTAVEPEKKPAAAATEKKPAAAEAPKKPTSKPATPVKKKGFVDKAIPWVIVVLISFLAGVVVFYFTLYQQKILELQTAQAQLVTAVENANAEQSKGETVKTDLTTAQEEITSLKTELADAQAAVEAKANELTANEQSIVVYKFQSDVNAARLALKNDDPASSRQALNFVKSDLAALEETGIDADAISGFEVRINEALSNLETDPQKSEEAMDTLYSNLLLLINNL